jgi:hypothetical protein
MSAATRTLLVLIGLAVATAACRPTPQEQNIENSAAATTEIEALPPDESMATPTNELANGDDEASNVDQPSNSY